MRIRTLVSLVLLLGCAAAVTAQGVPPAPAGTQHNLMPIPARLQFKPGRLPLGKSFLIATRGHRDERLLASLARFSRRLEGRTGMEFARELARISFMPEESA